MEAGVNVKPPRLLEHAICSFIPSAVREEIMGDLSERFQSPARYVAELVLLLPFLIFSQARRATNGSLFVLQAFALFVSFGGLELKAEDDSFAMWQGALLATLVALTVILIRNAYRYSDNWTSRRIAGDATAIVLITLVVQGVLRFASKGLIDPHWCLPGGFLVGGLLFSVITVFVLIPGPGLALDWRSVSGVQRLKALESEYKLFRRNLRIKNIAELSALCTLLAVVALFSLNARIPLVAAAAVAWVALALPIAIGKLMRARMPTLSSSPSLDAQLAFYRDDLVREQNDMGLVRWLCLGPVFIGLGLNMITRGLMNGWFDVALAGVTSIVLLALMIIRARRDYRRQLTKKIAALDQLGDI